MRCAARDRDRAGARRRSAAAAAFKRPGRPERHDHEPMLGRLDHALATRSRARRLPAAAACALGEPVALMHVLGDELVGDEIAGPDLAVRMGVRAAHRRALVLEQLHRALARPSSRLLAPCTDHRLQRRRRGRPASRRGRARSRSPAPRRSRGLGGEQRILARGPRVGRAARGSRWGRRRRAIVGLRSPLTRTLPGQR